MQIPEFNYDSLMKIFHTDIYGFPLFSLLMFATAGAFLGGWYWRRGTKVETKIVASNKATHIQTAEEFAGGMPEVEVPESPPRLNGGSDLEDRLINALAQAPWRVKEGSEIALAKNEESKKWGIATNKITFVLGGNEGAAPTSSAEPTPPNPEVTEETE